jgi:hypothetical protein
MLAASLDHSVYAARLAERSTCSPSPTSCTRARPLRPAIGAGGLVALVLTLLLSPLLAGMATAAARAPQPLASGALLAAGAQSYPRLARMLAWAIVPLGVAALLGSAAHHLAGTVAETARLEADAERASHLAMLATVVLLFVLAHATVDVGRAMLANDRRRTSSIGAWWRGCG